MFKFNRPNLSGLARTNQGLASVQRRSGRQIALADSNQPGVTNYNSNRYAPVWDRLEQGSVYEDWVPRNNTGINMMYRRIYARDAICGPAIDLWCNIPWSTFDIVGIEDPAIKRFYEEAFSWWDIDLLGQVSREFLVLGRFAGSLIYDDRRGYWNGIVPHDPDFLEITPVPVRGFDPKLDLLMSPGVRRFFESEDVRDARPRLTIPNNLLEKFLSYGKAPLDPLNTLFLSRKTSPYDMIGTSLMTRVVPFWSIEKALTDAMTIAARRRAGNILHVQAGIDGPDGWIPTPDEMDMISGLFMQADEDPTGAIVVTRNGLQVQEVRQGGQIWKLSDEFEFLTKGKMRALGINEAFLDGQACATADSLVQTSQGLIRIGEMRNKDDGKCQDLNIKVNSRYGEGTTAKWWYNGTRPTLKISSKVGFNLKCTGNHPVLVFNGSGTEWRKAEDLKVGDMMCAPTNQYVRKEPLKLNLSLPSDAEFYSEQMKPVKCPEYMTPDLAQLLGLIVSEGYAILTRHGKPVHQLRLVNTDEKLLARYRSLMLSLFGREPSMRVLFDPETTDQTNRKIKSVKKSYETILCSKPIVQLLGQLGVCISGSQKGKSPSHFKHVPWSILQADQQSQLAFISGFIEGDGGMRPNRERITLHSVSRDLLDEMQLLLQTHGIIARHRKGSGIEVQPYDSALLWEMIKPFAISKTFVPRENYKARADFGFSVKYWKDLFAARKSPNSKDKNLLFINDDGKEVRIKDTKILGNTLYFLYDSYVAGKYNSFLEGVKLLSEDAYTKLVGLLNLRYFYFEVTEISDNGMQEVFDLSMSPEEEPAFVMSGNVLHNSYNNIDAARSVFVEQIVNFRHTLTHQIFTRKAEILARAHGFRKRTAAQLGHRIRVNTPNDQSTAPEELRKRLKLKNLSYEESFRIPREELILPSVHWHKELKPNQDSDFIDMLEKLEDKLGFKLPLRLWTSSTGLSMDDLMAMIPEDQKMRKRIAQMVGEQQEGGGEGDDSSSKAPAGSGVAGRGGGDHAELFPEAATQMYDLPVWHDGKFLTLPRHEAMSCLDKLQNFKSEITQNPNVMVDIVASHFGADTDKRDGMNYLLMRVGAGRRLPISERGYRAAAMAICATELPSIRMAQELTILGSFSGTTAAKEASPEQYQAKWDQSVERIKHHVEGRKDEISKQLVNSLQAEREIKPTDVNLASGLGPIN